MSDIHEETVEPTTDDSNIEVYVSEEEQGQESQDVGNTEEGEATDGEEAEKPWKPKRKHSTPQWARDRFVQYSASVRELKEQNQQLMQTVQEMLNKSGKGEEDKKLSRDDFPDEQSYIDALADAKVQEKMSAFQKKQEELTKQREQYEQMRSADAANVQKATVDLPDYSDVIRNGDPDVTLPSSVIDHLSISPAGPYVRYKIAADEELSEALKRSTPQQKIQMVSELHDNILDYLSKKNVSTEQTVDAPVSAPVSQPAIKPATSQRKPPKAPPKQKGGTRTDLLNLDGDAYARARNNM